MLNSSFFKSKNTVALLIVVLVSSIIFLTSYLIQNGQFTFLNRATDTWTIATTPPPCTGTWQYNTNVIHDSVSISESYSTTFSSPKDIILYDWDNDPKTLTGGSLEVGHIFKVNGLEQKVPNQDPANDQKWATKKFTGVTSITYSINQDSGGSNICVVANSTTPTITKTPTPKPSVTTNVTPTKTPTPGMSKTPTPTGQICTLDTADIVLVIDRSGSMVSFNDTEGYTKLERAKQAAVSLLDRLSNTTGVVAKVGLVSFGSQGNDGTGKQSTTHNSTLNIAPTTNYASIRTAITNMQYIEDGTCIECGLRIANGQLTSTNRNRVVILLSDGRGNHIWDGSSVDETTANNAAITQANKGRSTGIKYYVLGYGSNANTSTLVSIAGNSANYKYQPDAKQWPSAFLEILDQVCQDIPTPTPTITKTPTPTPTKAPTPTNTPTKTPTNTPTKTPTPQPSDEPTNTPTTTPTPSNTPTKTPTKSPTPTTDITPTVPMCEIPRVENVRITCGICN